MKSDELPPIGFRIKIRKKRIYLSIGEGVRSLVTLAMLRGAAYMQRSMVAVLEDCERQRTRPREFYEDEIHFQRDYSKSDDRLVLLSWSCFQSESYIFELWCPQNSVSRVPAALLFTAGYLTAAKKIRPDGDISLRLEE